MTLEINFLEILRSSFTLWILIFCSILAFAVAIERLWYFNKIKIDVKWFVDSIKRLIDTNQFAEAETLCDNHAAPVPRVVKALLAYRSLDRGQLGEVAAKVNLEERMKAERYLGIMGTLGSMAPFIGLFGTVIGIIRAFHQLAVSNAAGGASVVAAGISEALVATAAGLFVAIPCIMLFNYFANKVKKMAGEIEVSAQDIIFFLAARKQG